MKRADRLARTAWQEAGMALLFFMAALAAGIWAVVAAASRTFPGGGILMLAAAIALLLAGIHARECLRVCRLALREMEWEVNP